MDFGFYRIRTALSLTEFEDDGAVISSNLCFYELADKARRQGSWDLLSYLKRQSRRVWVVVGDFNEILCDLEKQGDYSFGNPFTWCNQHPEPDIIYERLDKACADPAWRRHFSYSVVRHILVTSSDHLAILIDTENVGDTIISPSQAAFVPGRFITNNVLLAFEVNHYLRTKRWGKKGHMALKLDISKANDKVEWKLLQKVLARLGRLLVLYCRRRNGVLSCKEWRKNNTTLLKDEIQWSLRVRVEDMHDLYLGLLSVVGKSRRSMFQSIRDRILHQISGWNKRRLSQAGKEILLKAVA
ncbi:UNVERIFIED_CONTAM: hypothetical protein Scaly_2799900 [Sesamum calycinum]|uniref:Endonuclease/exonuclease/phosphatase domain-containing protein n=1 Tax=Sesamum calycinum TaxID=2727403 RepID=A0AAW2IW70_9LAMI